MCHVERLTAMPFCTEKYDERGALWDKHYKPPQRGTRFSRRRVACAMSWRMPPSSTTMAARPPWEKSCERLAPFTCRLCADYYYLCRDVIGVVNDLHPHRKGKMIGLMKFLFGDMGKRFFLVDSVQMFVWCDEKVPLEQAFSSTKLNKYLVDTTMKFIFLIMCFLYNTITIFK